MRRETKLELRFPHQITCDLCGRPVPERRSKKGEWRPVVERWLSPLNDVRDVCRACGRLLALGVGWRRVTSR